MNYNKMEASVTLEKRDCHVDFGIGQSPFPLLPSLEESLEKFISANSYTSSQGILELREKVALTTQKRSGFFHSSDDVVVANGAKWLLFLIQWHVPGSIILQRGSWVSYSAQAGICQNNIKWIRTDCYTGKIDLDALRREVQEGDFLFLNFPSNPWGVTVGEGDLAAIASIVYQKQLFVVSDEIYWPIVSEGRHFEGLSFPVANCFMSHCQDRCILVDSLSKWAGAGGWRLAFATFGSHPLLQKMKRSIVRMLSQTTSCVPEPIALSALRAFDWFLFPDKDCTMTDMLYIEGVSGIMTLVRSYAFRKMKNIFPLVKPAGAFYIFVPFPRSSLPLLKEKGVNAIAGKHFGLDGFIRLSLVCFNGEKAIDTDLPPLTDTKKVDEWMATYAPKIVEGIDIVLDIVAST